MSLHSTRLTQTCLFTESRRCKLEGNKVFANPKLASMHGDSVAPVCYEHHQISNAFEQASSDFKQCSNTLGWSLAIQIPLSSFHAKQISTCPFLALPLFPADTTNTCSVILSIKSLTKAHSPQPTCEAVNDERHS